MFSASLKRGMWSYRVTMSVMSILMRWGMLCLWKTPVTHSKLLQGAG